MSPHTKLHDNFVRNSGPHMTACDCKPCGHAVTSRAYCLYVEESTHPLHAGLGPFALTASMHRQLHLQMTSACLQEAYGKAYPKVTRGGEGGTCSESVEGLRPSCFSSSSSQKRISPSPKLNSVSAHSLALPQATSLFLLTRVSSIYTGLQRQPAGTAGHR